MKDIGMKYESIYFTDNLDIQVKTETISKLLNVFSEDNFLPTYINQPTNSGINKRLKIISQNGQWSIQFLDDRFQIEKISTDTTGKNLGTIQDFAIESDKLLRKILKAFPRKSNRLVLVSDFLLKDKTIEEYQNTYRKLFNAPNFFNQHIPFKWDWKSGSRTDIAFNNHQEKINVMALLSLRQGQAFQSMENFNKIVFRLDINTIYENREMRFDSNDHKAYLDEAIKLSENLEKEIFDFIQ